jgi:hypothetical protein
MPTGAKKGLNPARKVGSAPDSRGMTEYSIASGYAVSLAMGDPVKLTTDGTLIRATNGADAIGVFVGVSYVKSTGEIVIDKYWPASTSATSIKALVVDDPFVTFDAKGEGPIPLVQPGDIFALNLDDPTASTKSSNVTVDCLATVTGDVDIDAMTDLGENLTGADDADSFTIKTSAPGASAVTIALEDGDGYTDLLDKLNAVDNISATTTSGGLLQITATDGYDIVSAAGTGALWDDLFAGTVGTFSNVVAANAGLVKVVKVKDAANYQMEVVLVNHSLRDDG